MGVGKCYSGKHFGLQRARGVGCGETVPLPLGVYYRILHGKGHRTEIWLDYTFRIMERRELPSGAPWDGAPTENSLVHNLEQLSGIPKWKESLLTDIVLYTKAVLKSV